MPRLAGAMSDAAQARPDARQGQQGALQESGTVSAGSAAQASAAGFHPCADVFPLMGGEAFERLVADIKARGQCVPITRVGGLILDGRNRHIACLEAGVEPRFEDYAGALDPLRLVVSLNRVRRHMTPGQLAMAAARLATAPHGGDRRSDQAAKLPLVSQADAASMMGVSERHLRTARMVRQQGKAELVRQVERGGLSLTRAVKILASLNEARPKAAKELVRVEPEAAVAPALMQRSTDEVIWSAQQAAALRAGRDGTGGPPIDSEAVAQVLEAMGRDRAHRLAGNIVTVLKHLVKFDLATREHRGRRAWRRKTNRARCEISCLLAQAPSLQPTVPALVGEALPGAKRAALRELRLGGRRPVDPAGLSYAQERVLGGWFPGSPPELPHLLLPNLFCSPAARQCGHLRGPTKPGEATCGEGPTCAAPLMRFRPAGASPAKTGQVHDLASRLAWGSARRRDA